MGGPVRPIFHPILVLIPVYLPTGLLLGIVGILKKNTPRLFPILGILSNGAGLLLVVFILILRLLLQQALNGLRVL